MTERKPCVRVYLINLDRAVERRKEMEGRLRKAGCPFERVSAIDGQALAFPHLDFSEVAYKFLHGRRRTPAEVGCYLSHIECARRFLASDAEFALILEDDVTIPSDWAELLAAATEVRSEWDILRLSTVNQGRKFAYRELIHGRSLAIALTREKGAGAYMINRGAAHWLVSRLMPMRLAYDIAFDLEFLAGLRAVFVSPVPFDQNAGMASQIQTNIRSYRLPPWRYITVFPYRLFLETMRFTVRSIRLARLWLKYRS